MIFNNFNFFSYQQKINAASKLDAQLYPVLTTPSEEPKTIKQFVSDKLSGVLSEIAKASNEIDQRIHTTSALQPKDEDTRDKVTLVIQNLHGIKDKLATISSNYRLLLESLISYLGNIINTQTEIETYFRNKSQQSVNQDVNFDTVLSEHERFKDRIMEQFRELISESESIIDIVRVQEPDGAKEHDADRIIRLLEQLRMVFETQSDGRSSELSEKKKQNAILKFNKELNEIHQNLDDITKQLNDTQGQYGETAASARTIALGFEYFERTIQVRMFTVKFKSFKLLPTDTHEKHNFVNSAICHMHINTQNFITFGV